MDHARTLSSADFALLLGEEEKNFSPGLRQVMADLDFSHQVLKGREREQVILSVVKALWENGFKRAGRDYHQAWERGWGEILERFALPGAGEKELVPQYFRPFQIMRFNGEYLKTLGAEFELNLYTVLRRYVFERFLADPSVERVFEFGCGTGHNLVLLADMLPRKKLVGLDWARPSQELLKLINQKLGLDLDGHHFDFFRPHAGLEVPAGSAFLTMNALEQLGGDHGPFLDFCLAKRPALCLHTEPLEELYDQGDLMDHLAWRYHHQRGYLAGFLTRLRELEVAGRVEILECRRNRLGSLFHEGHSLLVWKPI